MVDRLELWKASLDLMKKYEVDWRMCSEKVIPCMR
jgi:hypothetical protein